MHASHVVLIELNDACKTIAGNHEYFSKDVDNWLRKLPEFNVKPLVNERVCLFGQDGSTCEGGIYLAGVEDYFASSLRSVAPRTVLVLITDAANRSSYKHNRRCMQFSGVKCSSMMVVVV